ncbi:ATP-binding cassette domain-containing protein [Mangrovimonas sp. CR14]|uniref:ABC transporter ATP-binding protein n=1 Tax=Mangrovimonas sp. CR14 TaxID=2706120 RepID=UPI00141F1A42|nr:ABC transporter ATP-binding protein [Mangrovimonas sp. CR14]NIK92516.1 ATP-binding cassette domain-containing protein [Mangrovimonas sp. CR14]
MNNKTNIPKDTESKNEVLVRVQGLSKKFCKDFKTSLWYGVKDLANGMLGRGYETGLRPKEFWAVKDVSFELRRGECLGLIGHNGAGKSTLLKLLNGLIYPDGGQIDITGRVGALIELGAGFNPILSGRENIYNNGAVLGFSRQEIDDRLEDIIAFAELEEFIDMPVQHYSSGMKVRLGFAVAAQMEPDVLIIDEVLAVGDLGFVLKCFKRIDTILPKTAIVFVSHSMPMVSRICNEVILLEDGKVRFQGTEVAKGIDLYYTRFSNNETNVVFNDGTIELESVFIEGERNENSEIASVNWNSDLKINFKFKLKRKVKSFPFFKVIIFDKEQRPVGVLTENDENFDFTLDNDIIRFSVFHQNLQLSKGVYSINILVSEGKIRAPLLRQNDIAKFQIIHELDIWPPFLLSAKFISR